GPRATGVLGAEVDLAQPGRHRGSPAGDIPRGRLQVVQRAQLPVPYDSTGSFLATPENDVMLNQSTFAPLSLYLLTLPEYVRPLLSSVAFTVSSVVPSHRYRDAADIPPPSHRSNARLPLPLTVSHRPSARVRIRNRIVFAPADVVTSTSSPSRPSMSVIRGVRGAIPSMTSKRYRSIVPSSNVTTISCCVSDTSRIVTRSSPPRPSTFA